MDENLYRTVSERANGFCELCRWYGGKYLDLHHIVGGSGKRLQHESEETCIMLCKSCHRETHRNRRLDLALKLLAQEKLKGKGLDEDQIRERIGGRLY